MPYIPKAHEPYDLLPKCRIRGREVFAYPGDLLDEIEKFLPHNDGLTPYGFCSYAAYDAEIDAYRAKYASGNERLDRMFDAYKQAIHKMNVKEDWSVARYLGPTTDEVFGLTHGKCYYWPCNRRYPRYHGVVDNEEFTSYVYPLLAEHWEFLEDPLGLASVFHDEKEIGLAQALHSFANNSDLLQSL